MIYGNFHASRTECRQVMRCASRCFKVFYGRNFFVFFSLSLIEKRGLRIVTVFLGGGRGFGGGGGTTLAKLRLEKLAVC